MVYFEPFVDWLDYLRMELEASNVFMFVILWKTRVLNLLPKYFMLTVYC